MYRDYSSHIPNIKISLRFNAVSCFVLLYISNIFKSHEKLLGIFNAMLYFSVLIYILININYNG